MDIAYCESRAADGFCWRPRRDDDSGRQIQHAARIAQETFGFTEPARKIDDFVRFMAAVREGKAFSGEPGGASGRPLISTADAAEALLANDLPP